MTSFRAPFVLLLIMVLQPYVCADGLELKFKALFDEIAVGDLVFYEVVLTNNSQAAITVERPSVGRNLYIEMVGRIHGRESRLSAPADPLPEPSERPGSTWTLAPGETKGEVLLVNLWGGKRRIEVPENLELENSIVLINSQPLGEYRDVIVEFAPFVESHSTTTAMINQRVLEWFRRRLFANGFDLNQRLIHFREPVAESTVNGIIKYGKESLIRKHCEMHVEIRSWVKDGLSEEVVRNRVEALIQEQRAPLQAWYRNRIQEELEALQVGREASNTEN